MSTLLIIGRYPRDSPLQYSDQVTVPARIWEELHVGHRGGERPLFVQLDAGPFARIRPATTGLSADSCQIPDWIWLQLGAPEPSSWVTLAVVDLPDAGGITLRPRGTDTLAAIGDPVAYLTAELTGSVTGQSWACLTTGAELPLQCGVFDVVTVLSIEGFPVPAACILNLDVELEIEGMEGGGGGEEGKEVVREGMVRESVSVPVVAAATETKSRGMWFPEMDAIVRGEYQKVTVARPRRR